MQVPAFQASCLLLHMSEVWSVNRAHTLQHVANHDKSGVLPFLALIRGRRLVHGALGAFTTSIVVALLILGVLISLQSSFLVEVFLLVLLDVLCILWLLAFLHTATFLATIPALPLGSNCQSIMSSIISSTSPSTIVWHIPTAKSGNQVVLVNCLGENGLDHFQRGRIALDGAQNVEVSELGHVEHSLEHVLEFSAGADAETLKDIQHILISQIPSRIEPLAAPKQEKFSLGNILP